MKIHFVFNEDDATLDSIEPLESFEEAEISRDGIIMVMLYTLITELRKVNDNMEDLKMILAAQNM